MPGRQGGGRCYRTPAVPFLVAFAVSAALSPAGISGAFLLLPYQVSVLGVTGPAVTPTNHLFNLLAAPAGVLRYARDGRLVRPLALVVALAGLPGAALGVHLRLRLLADPSRFTVFLALILVLFAGRLAWAALGRRPPAPAAPLFDVRLRAGRLEYVQAEVPRSASLPLVGGASFLVSLVGAAAGVGGGSLLAPLLVTGFGLPVQSVAGATLAGTFATSAVALGAFLAAGEGPDWTLGLLMGAGGIAGTAVGARLQRRLPARALEGLLALATVLVAGLYLARAAA